MLALDLDPARGGRDVHDAAVGHRHERGAVCAAEVRAQAEALAGLVARCGGQVLADVSPSGGRHVFVVFAAALPWLELRDVARALALRFPSVDTSPMSSLGGQISPPGSRHKSGGWRLLSVSLEDAEAVVANPNGPEVWAALLAELAAELRRIERDPACTTSADEAELDDAGVPWLPRLGGRAALGAQLEHVARTGRWDRSRYPGRSEARMAVLGAAASRGWRLAEVQSAIACGTWKGLGGLYERRSEPGRLERLLPYEWRKSTGRISQEENVRSWHTSDLSTRPPAGGSAWSAEYGLIRQWLTAVLCAAEDPERVRNWGRRAVAVRLVLLALGQAAMVSGSSTIEFGTRNLALYSALSHRTVARVLRMLRDEPDPLTDLVSPRQMARADRYALRIPDRYAGSVRWRRRRAGRVEAMRTRCSWSSAARPGWCIRCWARMRSAVPRWRGRPGCRRRPPRPHSGCSLSTGLPSAARAGGVVVPSPWPMSPSRPGRLACSGNVRQRYRKDRESWRARLRAYQAARQVPVMVGDGWLGLDDEDEWAAMLLSRWPVLSDDFVRGPPPGDGSVSSTAGGRAAG